MESNLKNFLMTNASLITKVEYKKNIYRNPATFIVSITYYHQMNYNIETTYTQSLIKEFLSQLGPIIDIPSNIAVINETNLLKVLN